MLKSVRGPANSVHRAVKKRWNCGCTKPHLAGLKLLKRLSRNDPVFSMAFNIPDELTWAPNLCKRGVSSV